MKPAYIDLTLPADAPKEGDLPLLHQLLHAIGEHHFAFELGEGEGATAPLLARLTRIKLDVIKKRLKWLQAAGLIEAVSYTPKRYRLRTFHLDMESPWVTPFTDHESPYRVAGLVLPD